MLLIASASYIYASWHVIKIQKTLWRLLRCYVNFILHTNIDNTGIFQKREKNVIIKIFELPNWCTDSCMSLFMVHAARTERGKG